MPKETISTGTSRTLLIVLFIIALTVRIIFALATPIKVWDETVYLNLGADLFHNPFDYSFSNGWSDYIPFTKDQVYGYPNAGFRAPLLPYTIAFLHLIQLNHLTNYLMPLIGALTVVLIYQLGKELFNKKAGLLAALFLTFTPLHLLWSGRVLTDAFVTFFVVLCFLTFWKGYEKGDPRFKLLFGLAAVLTLLARYTALWIFPVFFLYALFRGKIIPILSDKYTWLSLLLFTVVIIPWCIYGIATYGHPFGPFIHGAIASDYWGGSQLWYEYFKFWWELFSLPGFILIPALIYLFGKKAYQQKEVLLILIWFFFFLGAAIYTPHKEDRFILPLAPAIVLLAAYAVMQLKHTRSLVINITVLVLIFSASTRLYSVYIAHNNMNTACNEQIGNRLRQLKGEYLLVSENSPLTRYYSRQETIYYPDQITESSIKAMEQSTDKHIAFVFTRYNSGLDQEKFNTLINIMSKNYSLLYECEQDREKNWIFVQKDQTVQQNLVLNGNFESSDIAWVTNTITHISVNHNNRSDDPTSTKSARLIGSSKVADLHSALIPVKFGATYQFKAFADTTELQSTDHSELGFIIDEYTDTKQWIRALWLKNATPNSAAHIVALYTPGSPTVHSIRIQIYLSKGAIGTVYVDNVQLFENKQRNI